MFPTAKALPIVNHALPGMAAIIGTATVVAILVFTQSLTIAFGAIAGCAFLAFLCFAPTFWLAVLLIVTIPFQSLLTQLVGGFGSGSQQVFATWKELLLIVGIVRVVRDNPYRRQIMAANRSVMLAGGVLIFVYLVTFFRSPSIPAVYSLDLETRFLGIALFFMFLHLNGKQTATLLQAMIGSVGLVAMYGLAQYFFDYGRLLPLVYNIGDIYAGGVRRLYSYSLNALEPAYGVMIAILVLASGAARLCGIRRLAWMLVLVSCLLLTYTRSAYIGLAAGLVAVAVVQRNRSRYERHALVGSVVVCVAAALLLFSPRALLESDIGERLESIVSQSDQSSEVHKQGMLSAVEVIEANPFGIGLGKYGTVQARFDPDDAHKAENWVLEVAVGSGIPGAVAYIALTLSILVALLRCPRGVTESSKSARVAAAAAFVSMTVASVMIPVWDLLLPTVYAWALVGIGLSARAAQRFPATDATDI